MIKKIIIFSLVLFSFMQINAQNRQSTISKIDGMTLGLHSEDFNYSYNNLLIEIKNVGADWVSLVPKFYQQNAYEDSVYTNYELPLFWQQLENTIDEAQQNNLKVLLFPIVLLIDVENNEWRGKIKPNNLNLWFKNYEKLIIKLAKLAERKNVEMLCIGSEFNNLEQYESHWNNLIIEVRKNYNGKVTYSVNWDSIDDELFFYNLDAVGISGYFTLTDKKNASVTELTIGWEKHRKYLNDYFTNAGINYYFSEIGYTSLNGTNTNPWDRNISEKYDFKEQADCFEAFKNVWKRDATFSGVFFYDWFGFGGKNDGTFCIRNKPAAKKIEAYFK